MSCSIDPHEQCSVSQYLRKALVSWGRFRINVNEYCHKLQLIPCCLSDFLLLFIFFIKTVLKFQLKQVLYSFKIKFLQFELIN